MYETAMELAGEFGAAAVRAVGAVLAAAAGAMVELNGIETLGAGGEGMVGLWMAVLGGVLLLVGFVLAHEAVEQVRTAN